MIEFELSHAPDEADLQRVRDEVVAHGRALAKCGESEPLAVFARKVDRLVGGVTGRMELKRLFVGYIWVDERWRQGGLASGLLTRIEAAAQRHGCIDAIVESLLDNVAAMFRAKGYVTVGMIPDYVPGFTRHILLKDFGADRTGHKAGRD